MPDTRMTVDQLVEILTDEVLESYSASIVRRMAADLLAARALPTELQEQLDEARSWARHGYEIGQRTCTWADEGVAPKWLTEGHRPEALQPNESERRFFDLDTENAELREKVRNLERALADHVTTWTTPEETDRG